MTKFNTLKIGLATLLLVTCMTGMASIFTVTKSNSVAFPQQITLGATAIGDYTVTNNSTVQQQVYLRHLKEQGFQQVAPTNAQISFCSVQSGFMLSPKKSCTLRLAYASNIKTTLPATRLPIVCNKANTGCVSPVTPTSFTVVATPTPSAQLSTAGNKLSFTPGASTQMVVTNTSDVAANNVVVNLPSNLSPFLNTGASVTDCPTIAAHSTCTLKFQFQNYLPTTLSLKSFGISASNAPTIPLTGRIADTQISVSGTSFAQPGTQAIVVNNAGGAAASALSISISPSLTGVTAATGSTDCTLTLAAHSSCNYWYTVASNATGNTTATISFKPAGGTATSRKVGLTIANTSLLINGGQAIKASTTDNYFYVKNTGKFDAQGLSISKAAADTWLTLNTSACPATLGYGQSCKVTYTVNTGSAASGIISATATNANATSQNFFQSAVTSSIQIGVDGDAAKQHLSYQAIKITNSSTTPRKITSLTASIPTSATNISGKIELCDKDATNCLGSAVDWYKTTCYVGATINAGSSCDLWYKANSQTALLADTNNTIPISVTTSPVTNHSMHAGYPVTANIQMTYGNDFYIAAESTVNDQLNDHLVKWNGDNDPSGSGWTSLDNSAIATIYDVTPFDGDLYAGCYIDGRFAGKPTTSFALCKYNTQSMQPVTKLNGSINALAVLNHKLVIGGSFIHVLGVNNTNMIAQYNPALTGENAWSALGIGINVFPQNTIYTLAIFNNMLYAGGFFEGAGGVTGTDNIAKYNPATPSGTNPWSALGSGAGKGPYSDDDAGEVDQLGSINNKLWVSGGYGNVYSATGTAIPGTFDMAKWDPAAAAGVGEWSAFNPTIDFTSSILSGMTSHNNTAYALKDALPSLHQYIQYLNTAASSPAWSTIDTGLINTDADDPIQFLMVAGNKVLAIGIFHTIGPAGSSVSAISIAALDPSSTPVFSSLGQPDNTIAFWNKGTVAPSITMKLV